MEFTKMFLILAALCTSVRAKVPVEDVMKETLPAYTIAVNADILNSTTCRRELEEFRSGVDHRILWSLKMLDASGEPKSGFLYGNNHWIGRQEQCLDLMTRTPLELATYVQKNNSRYRKPEEEFPPFDLNYFVARFSHNSTLQYHVRLPDDDMINLGLCLPSSCATEELGLILESIFRDRTLLAGQLYSADFDLLEVKDLKDNQEWLRSKSSIFILFLIALTLALTIVGTAYDLLVYQKRFQMKEKFAPYVNNNTTDVDAMNNEAAVVTVQSESTIMKIIMCFSLYTNSKNIFNTKISTNSIPALHGFKFIGMAWIIMLHTVYYSYAYVDNKTESYRRGHLFAVQLLSNATLSVDTFFFLSGFLLTHVYLTSETSKKKSCSIPAEINKFFMLLLKRFIRITPTYMMIVGLAILNFSWYNNVSQFRMPENTHEVCTKYWWRNLLYINNLFSRETMCLSWSWYLSNDMQFFMFGSFILILSAMYFYTAVIIAVLALIGSIIITGYVTFSYGYIPTMDETFKFLHILYDPPWLRIAPYIIGMATAYLLSKLNYELHLGKKTLAFCWCCGILCNTSILFGLVGDRQISLTASAFYTALSRAVWGIGIAWVVIACTTKNAGAINSILSYKGWIPLSKLTFCVYLINPFIINSVQLFSSASYHVEFLTTGLKFIGILVICYVVAYVLSLMLEVPYILMLRMFTNRNREKK